MNTLQLNLLYAVSRATFFLLLRESLKKNTGTCYQTPTFFFFGDVIYLRSRHDFLPSHENHKQTQKNV
jgi:hypothetical protein